MAATVSTSWLSDMTLLVFWYEVRVLGAACKTTPMQARHVVGKIWEGPRYQRARMRDYVSLYCHAQCMLSIYSHNNIIMMHTRS